MASGMAKEATVFQKIAARLRLNNPAQRTSISSTALKNVVLSAPFLGQFAINVLPVFRAMVAVLVTMDSWETRTETASQKINAPLRFVLKTRSGQLVTELVRILAKIRIFPKFAGHSRVEKQCAHVLMATLDTRMEFVSQKRHVFIQVFCLIFWKKCAALADEEEMLDFVEEKFPGLDESKKCDPSTLPFASRFTGFFLKL